MNEIAIELGDGCVLRSLRDDDTERLFAVTSREQERLIPWMPWAHDLSLENTRAYHVTALEQMAAGEALHCVIACGDEIVGAAAINRIEPRGDSAPIGYWLVAGHEGRGLMTAAVTALINHAFGPFALHRVEIRAAPDNARSRAIPERLGFTQEGVLREAERFPDRHGDLVVYSLLRHEWSEP